MEKLAALKRIARALQLLRDERLRGFRVDIEVDSTIYGDSEQEKADRTQFIQSVTLFLQQCLVMGSQMPEIVPLLGKLLQFGVRGFRVGRDLELAIEEFTDEAAAIAKKRAAAASQQPSPQLLTAQAAMLKAQTDASSTQQKSQSDLAKTQADLQAQVLDNQAQEREAAGEVERQRIENQGEMINSIADLVMKQMDIKIKDKDLESKDKEMETQEYKAKVDAHSLGYKAKLDAHKQRTQAAKTTESSVAKTPKMPSPPKMESPPEKPEKTETGIDTGNLLRMLEQTIAQMVTSMNAPIDVERDPTGRIISGRRRMF
jgi:chemotaxis protein histidine kinase CheA